MNNRERVVWRFLHRIKHRNKSYFLKHSMWYIWKNVFDPYPRKIKHYYGGDKL